MSQVFEIYVIWINRSKICLCDAACFAGQTPLMRPEIMTVRVEGRQSRIL
jgi:hypothetical protein